MCTPVHVDGVPAVHHPRAVPPASAIRTPSLAVLAGAAVGVLGGLIGLGGAEFRLPREETQAEDRAQTRRVQEEAAEATRSRCRLNYTAARAPERDDGSSHAR